MKFFGFIFLFLISNLAWSQQNDSVPSTFSNSFGDIQDYYSGMKPPHGGYVYHAQKFDIEFLFDPFAAGERLTVYILNQKYKTRKPKKVVARALFKYADGRVIEKEMIRKEDWLFSDTDDVINPFNAIIFFKINKRKEFTAAFYYKGLKSK